MLLGITEERGPKRSKINTLKRQRQASRFVKHVSESSMMRQRRAHVRSMGKGMIPLIAHRRVSNDDAYVRALRVLHSNGDWGNS